MLKAFAVLLGFVAVLTAPICIGIILAAGGFCGRQLGFQCSRLLPCCSVSLRFSPRLFALASSWQPEGSDVAGAYTKLMRAVMAANPNASDDLLRAEFARRAMQDGTAQRILSVKADECLRFLVQVRPRASRPLEGPIYSANCGRCRRAFSIAITA